MIACLSLPATGCATGIFGTDQAGPAPDLFCRIGDEFRIRHGEPAINAPLTISRSDTRETQDQNSRLNFVYQCTCLAEQLRPAECETDPQVLRLKRDRKGAR